MCLDLTVDTRVRQLSSLTAGDSANPNPNPNDPLVRDKGKGKVRSRRFR